MRIFCPAIVLSSSLLLVPPSQTWPGGPHPLLCRSDLIRTFAHPRGRACRLGFGATSSLLADVGGGTRRSSCCWPSRWKGLLVRCGHRPDHRVQESLFSGQVI